MHTGLQTLQKHTSKRAEKTVGGWLLKRQERKTERRRRDALPAIKDAEKEEAEGE